MTDEKNPVGRPTNYTQELANEICEAIATSPDGLRKLCAANPHWPDRKTIWRWMFKHEEFSRQYARAKEFQVDCLAEEALEVAFDGSRDTYTDDNGKERCDHEWIGRSRLIVDTIKWQASKLKSSKYGDKVQATLTGKDGEPFSFSTNKEEVGALIDERISKMTEKAKEKA